MKKYLTILKKLSDEFQDDSKAIESVQYLALKVESLIEQNKSCETSEVSDFPIPEEIQDGGVAAFSDGACRGNPGPGSWGFIVQNSSGEIIVEGSDFEDHTTNNQMELTGAIKALEYFASQDFFSKKLYLFTDSTYVVKGITEWIKGWKARGWKKADRKAPTNLELWQKLDELNQQFDFLDFKWVKGHSGHPQNERCDQLANIALDNAGY